MSRKWIGLCLMLLLFLAMVGCTAKKPAPAQGVDLSKPPAQPVKIRMGWINAGNEIDFVLMKKPELLTYYGKWYTIEWFQFNGSGPIAQGLVAKSLDAATIGPLTIAQAAEKAKLDVVITGELHGERPGYNGTAYLVKDSSPIKTVADLKGKTCAVNAYGVSLDYALRAAIIKAGLKPMDDVRIVEIPFGLTEEALRTGKIDCGVFPSMYKRKALDGKGVRVLFNLNEIQPRIATTVQAFDRTFAEQNLGVMKAFQADYRKASAWLHDNRDQAIQLSAQVMNLDPKFLATYMFTSEDYFYPADGMPDLKVIQENFDFMVQYGFMTKKLDVNDYVIADLLK